MPEPPIPAPRPMPVDKEKWLSELHLSNFHNAYYEYRDTRRCIGDKGRILVVGPGQGLGLTVLRSRGYDVTTYDVDADMKPDHLGSVHDMSLFVDRAFDLVIASHVLEHMSFSLLDTALRELSRVARHAIVYLPFAGRHIDLALVRRQSTHEHHLLVNFPPFWRRASQTEPLFAGGQHFWEIGVRGISVRSIKRAMSRYFDLLECYQNPHWLVSMNFVLRSHCR